MSTYHWTLLDWIGCAAFALPLAILAWPALAWLWRLTACIERLLSRRGAPWKP